MAATASQLSAEAGRLNERTAFFRIDENRTPAVSEPIAARHPVHAMRERVAASGLKAPKRTKTKPEARGVDLDMDGGFERMSA